MPQVHNRELMRELGGAAGMAKNSRYMASVNYADATRKRITMLNKVEQKIHDLKVQVILRHERISMNRRETLIRKYRNSLRAIEAYQRVVMMNMFPRSSRDSMEYKLALEKKYNLDALRSKIKQKMVELDPSTIRAKQAQERLDTCRNNYENVLRKSLEHLEHKSANVRRRLHLSFAVGKMPGGKDDGWTSDEDDDEDDDEADFPLIGKSTPLKKDDHSPHAGLLRRPFLQRGVKRSTKHPPKRSTRRQLGKQNKPSSVTSGCDSHCQGLKGHMKVVHSDCDNRISRTTHVQVKAKFKGSQVQCHDLQAQSQTDQKKQAHN